MLPGVPRGLCPSRPGLLLVALPFSAGFSTCVPATLRATVLCPRAVLHLQPPWTAVKHLLAYAKSFPPCHGHVPPLVFQPCPAVRSGEVHLVHQEQHHLPQVQGVQVRGGLGRGLLLGHGLEGKSGAELGARCGAVIPHQRAQHWPSCCPLHHQLSVLRFMTPPVP